MIRPVAKPLALLAALLCLGACFQDEADFGAAAGLEPVGFGSVLFDDPGFGADRQAFFILDPPEGAAASPTLVQFFVPDSREIRTQYALRLFSLQFDDPHSVRFGNLQAYRARDLPPGHFLIVSNQGGKATHFPIFVTDLQTGFDYYPIYELPETYAAFRDPIAGMHDSQSAFRFRRIDAAEFEAHFRDWREGWLARLLRP
jgi:hypothetical protein